MPPGEKVQITVRTSLTNLIHAFPTHVGQAEKQKFVYFGNPFALTAYPATKQKTTVMYVLFYYSGYFNGFWIQYGSIAVLRDRDRTRCFILFIISFAQNIVNRPLGPSFFPAWNYFSPK